jgi:hypothetical protein
MGASDLMKPCFGCSNILEAGCMEKPSSAKRTATLPEKYFLNWIRLLDGTRKAHLHLRFAANKDSSVSGVDGDKIVANKEAQSSPVQSGERHMRISSLDDCHLTKTDGKDDNNGIW